MRDNLSFSVIQAGLLREKPIQTFKNFFENFNGKNFTISAKISVRQIIAYRSIYILKKCSHYSPLCQFNFLDSSEARRTTYQGAICYFVFVQEL